MSKFVEPDFLKQQFIFDTPSEDVKKREQKKQKSNGTYVYKRKRRSKGC